MADAPPPLGDARLSLIRGQSHGSAAGGAAPPLERLWSIFAASSPDPDPQGPLATQERILWGMPLVPAHLHNEFTVKSPAGTLPRRKLAQCSLDSIVKSR
eukprot:CAMPEP_0206213880 /NCGR_PEP_ID=MMETSP0047_2-20121206/1359_1 /ASSEMBLY_ACC=CAM_ASM_000192 /TAXON_ID=195065 /ORGANISM="Chroomonas mesostigmatica_cf, Strain CCMP1168" /LENGTH=99 /DNA_ID=CAMNT_0053636061 /DNA_START=660 /DNA_END=955 /DNA_ORIENTATION=-